MTTPGSDNWQRRICAPVTSVLTTTRCGHSLFCSSDDARIRQLAAKNLCTCHVRSDDDAVWSQLFRLMSDPDDHVRSDALHALTDSTPTVRVSAVVDALNARYDDPDPRLRRQIRKILALYRRTGKLSDAAR
ncbi:MAG: HEAT repeat domain-containing protein [Actinomycetota bacterium]|nr:HEAT repeat domain-containing protein [Actinomycetota bacterium]